MLAFTKRTCVPRQQRWCGLHDPGSFYLCAGGKGGIWCQTWRCLVEFNLCFIERRALYQICILRNGPLSQGLTFFVKRDLPDQVIGSLISLHYTKRWQSVALAASLANRKAQWPKFSDVATAEMAIAYSRDLGIEKRPPLFLFMSTANLLIYRVDESTLHNGKSSPEENLCFVTKLL